MKTLQRIHLDINAVTEMDYMVNVEGMTPREAARAWMDKNATRVESWMSRERNKSQHLHQVRH